MQSISHADNHLSFPQQHLQSVGSPRYATIATVLLPVTALARGIKKHLGTSSVLKVL